MKNSNVVLEIPSFQQEDAGGYECVAENKMGKNTVQGRLSFHGMIASHSPFKFEHITAHDVFISYKVIKYIVCI